MTRAGYEVDILIQGYPGKSICHGGLGWSTIALLRGEGRAVLVDVGGFGTRTTMLDQLAARGLSIVDVTDVVLTHAHYDHAINWVSFPKATIHIGEAELDWALGQPVGLTLVPELYVQELARCERLKRATSGAEIVPGMTAIDSPGHTPGHLLYLLAGEQHDVIFTGDSAKNRAELLGMDVDITMDAAASRRSLELIWSLWSKRPGNIVIPGHDLPMILDEDGRPSYVGERRAAIRSWFSSTLEECTLIDLAGV